MDRTGFAGMAGELPDSYTVVTYDPRGISNSTLEDDAQDLGPPRPICARNFCIAASRPSLQYVS
jgi:hypothetical protein